MRDNDLFENKLIATLRLYLINKNWSIYCLMCIKLVNSYKKFWCRCKNCSLQIQQNMAYFLSKAELAMYGKSTVF